MNLDDAALGNLNDEELVQKLEIPRLLSWFCFIALYAVVVFHATDYQLLMFILCCFSFYMNIASSFSYPLDSLVKNILEKQKIIEIEANSTTEAEEQTSTSMLRHTAKHFYRLPARRKLFFTISTLMYFLRLLFCNRNPYCAIVFAMPALGNCVQEQTIITFVTGSFLCIGTAVVMVFVHAVPVAHVTICVFGILLYTLFFYSFSFMDVHKQLKYILVEKQLKEALNAKSSFVSFISHEFRTPLLSVNGSIELLKEMHMNKEQLQHLHTIQCCSNILLYLIEDILQFSKLDVAPLEENTAQDNNRFNLLDAVTRVCSILKNYSVQLQVPIQLKVGDEVPKYIKGNVFKVQQVLINLLTNAIKVSKPNSQVILSVDRLPATPTASSSGSTGKRSPRGSPSFSAGTSTSTSTIGLLSFNSAFSFNRTENATCRLVFNITDFGPGIPKEKENLLFTPFGQVEGTHNLKKLPGTGLGLVICKKIIEKHGGTITYKTELKKGTTFTVTMDFTLPTIEEIPIEMYQEPPGEVVPSMSARIETSPTAADKQSKGIFFKPSNLLVNTGHEHSASTSEYTTNATTQPVSFNYSAQVFDNIGRYVQYQQQYMEDYNLAGAGSLTAQTPIDRSPAPLAQVVVAEDNYINKTVLTRLISKDGLTVHGVSNGKDLVDYIVDNYEWRMNQIEEGSCVLPIIVTDYRMPVLDGIEASKLLKQKFGAKVKIILLTADAFSSVEMYKQVVDVVQLKPIDGKTLCKCIRELTT